MRKFAAQKRKYPNNNDTNITNITVKLTHQVHNQTKDYKLSHKSSHESCYQSKSTILILLHKSLKIQKDGMAV